MNRDMGTIAGWVLGPLAFAGLLILSFMAGAERSAPALSGKPMRIVSLAPSITEILFAEGLGDEVVGVTDYCDYPPAALGKPKVGGFKGKSLEAIIGLSPDLVVATRDGNEAGLLRTLARLRIPALTVQPSSLNDVIQSIRLIGSATGREQEAERLARSEEDRLRELGSRLQGAPRPRVLFVYGRDPLVLAGPGTFADDMIRLAGGLNVAGDATMPYPRYSMEAVMSSRPEVIVEGVMGTEALSARAAEVRAYWSRWSSLPAVESGRVLVMDQDLITRPGPRLFDGLWELAKALHPERFQEGRD